MLVMLQDIARETGNAGRCFTYKDFDDPDFQRRYSDYLLGEIKDHLMFYYGASDYELFLKFFEFLKGKNKVSHPEYKTAFANFRKTIALKDIETPKFMSTHGTFLQFLYDLNVICYIEQPATDRPYYRWCFRERSHANISPKVKEEVRYEVFYGLSKALNVGQEFK